MHVNFWTFIWIYVYSFFIKRTKTGDTNSEIEACLADANFVPLLLRSIPQNVGRKSRKLQKSKKTSRTKVLPLMIRKPRRYSTAQWRDAWKHFFGLLHYSIIYSPEISEQENRVQSKSWCSCVNHEKSKKLSKRASLSSIRIFSKWPRTLAERRPHKTKKWPIVDSILVPHVSSTILIWKQRKTPSNKYERSSGNSKQTSTWGNEQKKGWYRSSSRNARI